MKIVEKNYPDSKLFKIIQKVIQKYSLYVVQKCSIYSFMTLSVVSTELSGGTEFDGGQSSLVIFILPRLIIFFLVMKWDWGKRYSALH